tara:strand:- start:786 stop:1169 length:384 start_codon:yes stop_codon:yes gene_type:complete
MKNITIAGNVTKDAEVRKTQNGGSVTGFSLAVNDRRTKETIFFDCSYWGKGGEAVSPYLTKGTAICAAGEFGTREYNGKTYLTCNINDLDLQGGRSKSENPQYSVERLTNDLNKQIGPLDLDDEIPF